MLLLLDLDKGNACKVKVKSCKNPLRLGTVIVLVSSGIDVCIATEPPAKRDCQFGLMVGARGCPEGAQSAWTLQETHRNSTSFAQDEARTPERLFDRQTP